MLSIPALISGKQAEYHLCTLVHLVSKIIIASIYWDIIYVRYHKAIFNDFLIQSSQISMEKVLLLSTFHN